MLVTFKNNDFIWSIHRQHSKNSIGRSRGPETCGNLTRKIQKTTDCKTKIWSCGCEQRHCPTSESSTVDWNSTKFKESWLPALTFWKSNIVSWKVESFQNCFLIEIFMPQATPWHNSTEPNLSSSLQRQFSAAKIVSSASLTSSSAEFASYSDAFCFSYIWSTGGKSLIKFIKKLKLISKTFLQPRASFDNQHQPSHALHLNSE